MGKNVLAFDLEDWHQLVQRIFTGSIPPVSKNLFAQLEFLLELLEKYNTKATFFTLGMVAKDNPQLIRRIAESGHEIASHGYYHKRVYDNSPEFFQEDARNSKLLLEDIIGSPIAGYRAPEFSIVRRTLWALEILAELGYSYDSSIFPIYHRRYGIPDFDPGIYEYQLKNGCHIIEIPLTVYQWGKIRLPLAGGGYFRLLPLKVINNAVTKLNQKKIPLITYFHPYELDSTYLNSFDCFRATSWKQKLVGLKINFNQNLRRQSVAAKLNMLLTKFPFTTFQNFLKEISIPKKILLY